MDVSTLDYWATQGRSPFHRAGAWAKLTGTALTLAAVIVTRDPFVLLGFYLILAAAVVLARLPVLAVLGIAAYPAVFALLMAMARWDGSLVTPGMMILKALGAALAMVLLITTTPYPEVFATLRRIVGPVLGDALFLTYRCFFLLLDLFRHRFVALRARSGLQPWRWLRNGRNLALVLGHLIVDALELSERLYAVMRVRSYAGRLAPVPRRRPLSASDLLPLAMGGWVLIVAIFFRLGGASAAGYNGSVLILALAGILVALAFRGRAARIASRGR